MTDQPESCQESAADGGVPPRPCCSARPYSRLHVSRANSAGPGVYGPGRGAVSSSCHLCSVPGLPVSLGYARVSVVKRSASLYSWYRKSLHCRDGIVGKVAVSRGRKPIQEQSPLPQK